MKFHGWSLYADGAHRAASKRDLSSWSEIVLPDISELPVVTGLKPSVVKDDVYLNPEYAQVIRQTFESLFNILDSRRLKLEMQSINNINLLIEDVLRVKLGRPDQLEKKISNFEALLPVIGKDFNQVEYVDLRYIHNPAVKFR